jgi:hypothetical protein
MTTPEGKVKAWAYEQYKILFPGHWSFAPRGGPFGKGGTPDRLICWHGIFIAIEVKGTSHDEPTDLQRTQLEAIAKAGGVAAVLKGKDLGKLFRIRDAALSKMDAETFLKAMNPPQEPRVWINECPSA